MRYRTCSSLFVLLLASCEDAETIQTDDRIAYDYALDLPDEYAAQEVTGIDSRVEEFHSSHTVISTDFGHYSSPPNCTGAYLSCEIEEEEIAGRRALVGRYRHAESERPAEPKPHRIWLHLDVAPQQDLDLNLFARCDTLTACERALGYFRQVRIVEAEAPPAGNEIPPAAPPRLPAPD